MKILLQSLLVLLGVICTSIFVITWFIIVPYALISYSLSIITITISIVLWIIGILFIAMALTDDYKRCLIWNKVMNYVNFIM